MCTRHRHGKGAKVGTLQACRRPNHIQLQFVFQLPPILCVLPRRVSRMFMLHRFLTTSVLNIAFTSQEPKAHSPRQAASLCLGTWPHPFSQRWGKAVIGTSCQTMEIGRECASLALATASSHTLSRIGGVCSEGTSCRLTVCCRGGLLAQGMLVADNILPSMARWKTSLRCH